MVHKIFVYKHIESCAICQLFYAFLCRVPSTAFSWSATRARIDLIPGKNPHPVPDLPGKLRLGDQENTFLGGIDGVRQFFRIQGESVSFSGRAAFRKGSGESASECGLPALGSDWMFVGARMIYLVNPICLTTCRAFSKSSLIICFNSAGGL